MLIWVTLRRLLHTEQRRGYNTLSNHFFPISDYPELTVRVCMKAIPMGLGLNPRNDLPTTAVFKPIAKTHLGLLTLVCLIVGNMIGAGVYVNSFYSLSSLHDARLVLIVWLVGGIHALCGAVAYGSVASRLPVSGGEYTYLSRCVHPGIGFVAGWVSIIAGFTAPIAVTALLLGNYVVDLATVDPMTKALWQKIVATLAIALAGILHACHLRIGTGFNNAVIAVKLLCFSVFLAIGIPFILSTPSDGMLVMPSSSSELPRSLMERLADPATLGLMLVQLFYVSLAYTGFNASIYLAGDIDDRQESSKGLVALSMWISCVLVMILYLLLNAVFLYGLSATEIVAAGEGFVPVVAKHIGGESLSMIMRVAIILSALTSVLSMMATGPMVYAQMARDGWLPQLVHWPSQSTRRPIAIQAALSCLVVWFSTIEGIISYLGLTLTACGALAVSSIWIAKTGFTSPKPVRWYEHMATATYVGGAILLLIVASQSEAQRIRLYLCLATFATGAIFYFASRSSHDSSG
ncbi:MAG: amino acid permease [Pirellula sp.]